MVFASTGTKKPRTRLEIRRGVCRSDIETNPPATNRAALDSGKQFHRTVDRLPDSEVLEEIDRVIDFNHLELTLMREGVDKFVEPQKALIDLIASRRLEFARD